MSSLRRWRRGLCGLAKAEFIPARRLVMRTVLADAVKLKVRVDTTPKDIYVLTATKKIT